VHYGDRSWLRRLFAAGVLLLAALSLLTACTVTSSGTGSATVLPRPEDLSLTAVQRAHPNIVFVLSDDLSTNLVQYMPHVLELERRGVSFSNYYVVDSLCCPSRSAIFTGQYPHDDGVFSNSGSDGGYPAYLAHHNQPKNFSIALQRAGYRTGFMGKYLNGYYPWERQPPGWSYWLGAGSGYGEFKYWLNENGNMKWYGSKPADYLTDVMSAKADQFVASSAQAHAPFALEIATFAPHFPYVPAPRDLNTYRGLRAPRGPAFGRLPKNAPAWLTPYPRLSRTDIGSIDLAYERRVESVQAVDRLIARLATQLAVDGQLDNTYFVFSSDNGVHLGEYRLRPGKTTAFDIDVKVPLIVAGPGVPRGRAISAMASSIDLAPTFAQIAHARLTDVTDGVSLLSLWRGATPGRRWQQAVLVEHHGPFIPRNDPDYQPSLAGYPPSYEAIRTATALYVEYADGEREYYDLRTDPFELDNVAGAASATTLGPLQRMLHLLENCHDTLACQAAAHP
jgi:arylsulfatase A-like enzyme